MACVNGSDWTMTKSLDLLSAWFAVVDLLERSGLDDGYCVDLIYNVGAFLGSVITGKNIIHGIGGMKSSMVRSLPSFLIVMVTWLEPSLWIIDLSSPAATWLAIIVES